MARHFGIRIIAEAKDKVVGEIDADDRHLNAGGIVHGGAYMAFADELGGHAASLHLSPGTRTTVRPGASGGIPNGSRSPWTTSVGTVTASSSKRRLLLGSAPLPGALISTKPTSAPWFASASSANLNYFAAKSAMRNFSLPPALTKKVASFV